MTHKIISGIHSKKTEKRDLAFTMIFAKYIALAAPQALDKLVLVKKKHKKTQKNGGMGGLTMREILFRGKRLDNGEWVEGFCYKGEKTGVFMLQPYIRIARNGKDVIGESFHLHKVDPETVGQYTGLCDKNGKKIFEGDIVEYNTFDDFNCYSVVKMGEYTQDGSGGEYKGRDCIGVYVEVDNFTCPDWADDDPLLFHEYLAQQNLTEVNAECEVIGNIYDESGKGVVDE